MTEENMNLLGRLVGMLSLAGIFFLIGYGSGKGAAEGGFQEKVDTCTIERTIVDSGAFLAAKKQAGYELVRVASIDSLKRLADEPKRIVKEVECEVPVIVEKDSVVYIQVPMEDRTFTGEKDSVEYSITAYGYNTELKSVSFTYPEKIVTRVKVYDNTKKFGFGMAVGATTLVTPMGRWCGGFGATAGLYIRF